MTNPSVPDVVTIGDVMLDVTVVSSALARGGDVHGNVRLHPGGSAANAAVWAAAAGATARVHGRVGDDIAGRLLVEALRERGVVPAIVVQPGARTGAMLVVTETGERSMVADRGANAGLALEDLPATVEAGAVLVSGYTLFDPRTEPVALAALARARAAHVAIDAASWPLVVRFGRDCFVESTRLATVLFANEREAAALAGPDISAEEAVRRLAGAYRMAVVKLGARGALLATGDVVIHQASPAVEELDATGAGDAFDGTFLAALVAGASPEEALQRACAAGARAAASAARWPEVQSAWTAM